MNSSFYNGISGVKTHQFGLDVWANNISNISTHGFRSSTPEFSSLFAATLAGSYFDPTSNDKGLGSQSQTTNLSMTQGILENTDNPFDLAIDGEGWFGVQGQNGQTYYTRAGQFSIDSNGNLVDLNGNYLLATSGNNITATTLNEEKLNSFGKYYNGVTTEPAKAYAISKVGDVALGSVGTQTKVTLPDYLYFPPEATTYVNYQANLNPKITTQSNTTDIDTINAINLSISYPKASISGTMANNTDITGLKEGDTITLQLMDGNKKTLEVSGKLDANLNFSIIATDISSLDENTSISAIGDITITQEIPNVEHFTTDIIAPDGEKNIVDMTFTKRVPQEALETTWDADIQILRYVEPYKIEQWNPNINYDETLYNVDTEKKQVTKIYDPSLYKVDLGQNKVYEIIDQGKGVATFGGGGEILSSTMPTLSNGETPFSINIGDPYSQENVSYTTAVLSGNNYVISGKVTNLVTQGDGVKIGDNVAVKITDANGEIFTTSGKIGTDGTWQATYENFPSDTSNLTIESYVVINSGYEGIISHVDLNKSKVVSKDGHAEGFLTQYGMDDFGNVIAEFSNGRSSAIAKVALYHFQNDQGLLQTTSTLFVPSANSGNPIFYADAEGNTFLNSRIRSNYLEGSNVSMATALTELIVMQKSFDANAKSITTSDQLIQNAINMKRN